MSLDGAPLGAGSLPRRFEPKNIVSPSRESVARASFKEVLIVGPRLVGDDQVFTNLLSNAIRFTPAGGYIRVLLASDRTSVEVKVSDTGRGISAECLPDIFNSFRRAASRSLTEPGGLGLGLDISRRLIERHGGPIYAFSRGEGQGSTFMVHLPGADVNVGRLRA